MRSLLLVFLGALNLHTYSSFAANIYVSNQYGATLAFKVNDNSQEVRVNANKTEAIGSTTFGEVLESLKIRTTGKGSTFLSPYTDISTYLKQIKDEQSANKKKDAYLVIKPSYTGWNIQVEWH